jgi:hypothetical protein
VTQAAANIQGLTAVIPVACNFDALQVAHQANAGQANDAYSYFLVKLVSGTPVNQALTCNATTSAASTVTCSDNSHSVAAAVGDQFTIGAFTANTGTTPAGRIMVSVRCR